MNEVNLLRKIETEFRDEWTRILQYWIGFTRDDNYGGFIGSLDNDNRPDTGAPKGAVLNARILWTFAAAYRARGENEFLGMADRAYNYIILHFNDTDHGGIYWSVDFEGQPLDTRKQVYALAFGIYAFSEYYSCNGAPKVLEQAIEWYELLQQHSFDALRGGYMEAFSREWKPLEDLRLSPKDANEKKTMNTHLHVLEAYGNLYSVWPDAQLTRHIEALLKNFRDHFVDPQTGHLRLFFDEDWNPKPDVISYGHDIEASWLLLDMARIIGNLPLINEFEEISLKMAVAAAEGLDADGGLWYEFDPLRKELVHEKHWWPQAEALVGFFNAWQLSGNPKFLSYMIRNWKFIRRYIIDGKSGEWYWGVGENHSPMPGQDKVGFWKCPYHNSRACLEMIKRIEMVEKKMTQS
jgi:mannobiose 2-epimerase